MIVESAGPLALGAAIAGVLGAANRGETSAPWRRAAYACAIVLAAVVATLAATGGLPLALPCAPGAFAVPVLALPVASWAVAAAVLAGLLLLLPPLRRAVGWLLPMYHAESPVHAITVALAVMLLLAILAVAGRPRGPTVGVLTVAGEAAGLSLAVVAGAGLGTRRGFAATMHRLGMRAPGPRAMAVAAGLGVVLGLFALALGRVLGAKLGTAAAAPAGGPALLLAGSLVFGLAEEVVFRAGLRPRLGNFGPSVLYGLFHAPALSLAAGGYFVSAMVLGRVWQRYGLAACMVAHSVAVVVVGAAALRAG